MFEIHIYHHIITGDMATLEATIATLEDRIANEVPAPEDFAALDALEAEATGFRPGEPEPPAPAPR